MLLRRVIRTPLTSVWCFVSCDCRRNGKGTCLIYALLQYSFLLVDTQASRVDNIRLEDKKHNGIFGRASAIDPITSWIELSSHSLDVLTAFNKDARVRLEHVEGFAGGGGKHGRKGSREGV